MTGIVGVNKQPLSALPQTLPDGLVRTLRHFIGILMIVPTAHKLQRVKIQSDVHIPRAMKVERAVLDAIYRCIELEQDPTEQNVISLLKIAQLIDDPEAEVRKLVDEGTVEPGETYQVAFLSLVIDESVKAVKLSNVGLLASEIALEPALDYRVKFDKVLALIEQVRPRQNNRLTFTYHQMIDKYIENEERLRLLRQKGLPLGVKLPFPKLNRAIGDYIEWSETVTLMSPTGFGKTTLAWTIGEYNAWEAHSNCDVHYFSVETNNTVLARRALARNLEVPYIALKNGDFLLSSPEGQEAMREHDARTRRNEKNSGMFRVVIAPGISVGELTDRMARSAEASKALGRNCLFIVDYLQRIGTEGLSSRNRHEQLSEIMDKVTIATRQIDINNPSVLLMVAQEGGREGEAFGSSDIRRFSQLLLTIKRELVAEGLPHDVHMPKYLPQYYGGMYRKQERRMAFAGEKFAPTIEVSISKSNDASPQSEVLWFEGSIGKLYPTEEDNAPVIKRYGVEVQKAKSNGATRGSSQDSNIENFDSFADF